MPTPAGPSDAVVTLDEVKTHLNFHGASTDNDAELQGFIETAVAIVQGANLFGPIIPRTYTETVRGARDILPLSHTPILSITSVTSYGGTAVDVADLDSDMAGGLVRYAAGGSFSPPVVVVYEVGRDYVPPEARMMCLDLIRINWRPQQGGNRSAYDEEPTGPGTYQLGFFVPSSLIAALGDEAQLSGLA